MRSAFRSRRRSPASTPPEGTRKIEEPHPPRPAAHCRSRVFACRRPGRCPGQRHARRPQGTKSVNWPTYNADLAGSRYLPLDQIDGSNFKDLEIAWRFKTDMFGSRPEYKLEGTPLAVDGVVYATAGTRRAVVALNAVTGELLWSFSSPRRQAQRRKPARAVGPRPVLLERRHQAPHPLHHHRLSPDQPRCRYRPARPRFRRKRHRRSEEGLGSGDRSISKPAKPAPIRRPPFRAIPSSSAPPSAKASRPRTRTTPRAMSAPSTCAPASGCGPSTPSPSPANSAMTPGTTTAPTRPATPASGRRSRSIPTSTSPISTSNRRRATFTAGIAAAPACSATASSLSI